MKVRIGGERQGMKVISSTVEIKRGSQLKAGVIASSAAEEEIHREAGDDRLRKLI